MVIAYKMFFKAIMIFHIRVAPTEKGDPQFPRDPREFTSRYSVFPNSRPQKYCTFTSPRFGSLKTFPGNLLCWRGIPQLYFQFSSPCPSPKHYISLTDPNIKLSLNFYKPCRDVFVGTWHKFLGPISKWIFFELAMSNIWKSQHSTPEEVVSKSMLFPVLN
jgi:hypothetical protein